MILTITGADFSGANIGTNDSVRVSVSVNSAALSTAHGIPSYVKKDSSVSWTITLKEGYTFGEIVVSMEGGGQITKSISGNTLTISSSNVTGKITINVPTSGGEVVDPEPEEPGTGGGNTGAIDLSAYEMRLGNKSYAVGNVNESSTTRVCTVTNPYFETGWKVTVDGTKYKMAGAVTTSEESTDKKNGNWDLTSNGFNSGLFTVAESGYYMLVFQKIDIAEEFVLTTDGETLDKYITITQ